MDTFIHTFNGRVFGQSAEDNEAVKQLSEGEFLVVVETKFKGTNNKDAFKIFGFQNGLKMAEGSQTSLENDGCDSQRVVFTGPPKFKGFVHPSFLRAE